MFTLYFAANVEGAERIAVVQGENLEAIKETPEASNREIAKSDLPEDFADWKRYTAHAYLDGGAEDGVTVSVMSREGD